jgi:asparagine synthase (glutamine-hydrolysing)
VCGLLGGIWRNDEAVDAALARRALALIAHRGPDAEGFEIDRGVFLGHRRLSIIDLDQRANQPMRSGPLSMVYNGEIYNFHALRTALERRGAVFKTNSDTEVVLQAFALDGIACLESFEGMFALAIWDSRSRKLTLARDRFGEKPMNYFSDPARFLFGSEIPPIQLLAGGALQVDEAALPFYFRFSYLPAPISPFVGMRQLEPGTALELDCSSWQLKLSRYYSLAERVQRPAQGKSSPKSSLKSPLSFDDAKTELRDRMTNSVNDRMMASDVPVATFLSGGLDSSIIASLASRSGATHVAAYSIGFPNDPEFDESPYARLVARRYPDLDHRVVDVTEDTLIGFTENTLALLGEPYGDASIIPTAFLCSHVEEKVILGGDGADEIFGGYGTYSAMLLSGKIPRWLKSLMMQVPASNNPSAIRNPMLRAAALFHKHLRIAPIDEYLSWRSYATEDQLRALGLSPERAHALPLQRREIRSLQDLLVTDIEFNLPADMLKKVDLASMQHGLEVRLPYLDSGLVEFALSLPAPFVIANGHRKHILREAFRERLPDAILTRRKQGFLLPIRKWMKAGRMREELLALSAGQTALDSKAIEKLADRHRDGKEDLSALLWYCYVYFKWIARQGGALPTDSGSGTFGGGTLTAGLLRMEGE